jgi:periplasmic divalent cation tolerance protein
VTDTRVVLMTVPDLHTAEAVVGNLVVARLAACASILPGVTSLYWWEGEVQRSSEVLVVMKTPAECVDALISRAAELHPYDVPELLALPVENGLSAYLAWVGRECRVAEEE